MYPDSRKLMSLVSDRDREIFEIINYCIITGVICVFGVVANVMNIMVFYKQGFNNTMNISFFGIAISDLCALVNLLWCCICVNPLFTNSDTGIVLPDIMYLTGGIPHACFARITGWITVFVTAERCLCIIKPLEIKQLITPRRTTLIVCLIYLVIMVSFLPEYSTCYFDWKFYSERNKTLIGLAYTNNRKSMEGLCFFFYSFLGTTSFLAVIVFTVLLVLQLKEKSKWRSQANVDKTRSEIISTRDRKTMNMVVMIATVLILCYTPGAAVSMTTFFEAEYSMEGTYVNLFLVSWSFVFICQALNSSVNIFLYYKMSTKYRDTFHLIFHAWTTRSPAQML